jgi:hypothetical protein
MALLHHTVNGLHVPPLRASVWLVADQLSIASGRSSVPTGFNG